MVVAQLVDWWLLTPEVRSSNPIISKLFYRTFICLLPAVLKRQKQRKRAREWSIYWKLFCWNGNSKNLNSWRTMSRGNKLCDWRFFNSSSCSSVGWAVASDSRGQQFEPSHGQKFILHINCQLYWNDENKEKEVGNGPFKKIFQQQIMLKHEYRFTSIAHPLAPQGS